MPNANYVLTTEGSFLGESELYHHGVPGMKCGRRKAVVKSGSIGTNRNYIWGGIFSWLITIF